MENDANEETGNGQRVPQLRTILISVAVSCLSISPLLNLVSRSNLTMKYGEYASWDDLKEIYKMTQLSYVAVGILSYVAYAWLFERCRRKTLLYSVCVSQFATSVIQLCTNSYWTLHVSRASAAVSDVGAAMFCVIYVSEIAPDEIRGALVAIPELFISFSSFVNLLSSLLPAYLMEEYSPCISIYVSALVAIVTYAAVPESPIYFLRRDDIVGAKHSLTFLHGNGKKVFRVIANRRKILKATRSDSQTSTSVFRECISRRAVSFTCMMIALFFLRTTLLYLDPLLWRALTNWYLIDPYCVLVIIFFVKVVGNLLGIVLCDRVGRKRLLFISTIVCSITLIGTGIYIWGTTNAFWNKTVPSNLSTASSLVFVCVYIITLNLGVSILPEVLITDIFPSKILNIQMVILGSFQLYFDYVFYMFIEMDDPREIYRTFWFYGGLIFIVALLIRKFLSETKCRPPGFKFIDSEERVLFSSLQEAEE